MRGQRETFHEIHSAFDSCNKAHQAIIYLNLTEIEAWSYEMSLKHYRDLLNVVNTAYQQAFEEGFKQGERMAARQVAMNMLKDGIAPDIISKCLGISVEELERLNESILPC